MKHKSVNTIIKVISIKGTYLAIIGRIMHLQLVENRGENLKKKFTYAEEYQPKIKDTD